MKTQSMSQDIWEGPFQNKPGEILKQEQEGPCTHCFKNLLQTLLIFEMMKEGDQ